VRIGHTVAIGPHSFDDSHTLDDRAPAVVLPARRPRAAEHLAEEVSSDFAEMFEQYYRRVVRALELSGLDRPAAEDAAQEAFARTLGHWTRVRGGSNPPGYVFRTAFRLARRQLARAPELPIDEGWSTPDQGVAAVATRIDVERCLASMPVRRRACAVCCLVVGLSTKETARTLGIAEGTVRKQLERARADLRLALDDGNAAAAAAPHQ
jgi:RNA polymerase sigma factor (sigma-70 family)